MFRHIVVLLVLDEWAVRRSSCARRAFPVKARAPEIASGSR
jgi:hypothetical protein